MTGATGKKILLVDYEVSKMKATEDFLTQAGFEVVKAFDGLDALEKFSEEQPDLVLLSAMLPKLHGFEVCKAIKHSDTGRKIPVLITTSVYKSYKYKRQAMKDYLADDYILKPFNYEELLAKIREHLGLGEIVEGPLHGMAEGEPAKAGPPEETDGEFESLLDQTLETLLNKSKDKPKAPPPVKPEKKPAESSSLDEILETTLSGLLSEIGDKKQPAKPVLKKKPKPEEPVVRTEEMKTIEYPVPDVLKLSSESPTEETETVPADFDLDGLTAPEEEILEPAKPAPPPPQPPPEPVVAIEEPAPVPSSPEEVKVEVSLEQPPAAPAAESDQLDKIIDEAIAIFEEEISEEKRAAATTPPVSAAPPEAAPPVFTEPVPGAEVKLDSDSRFGKYKLIEKIAVGGMAEMWKAKQIGPEGFEKLVALKRILPNLAENEDFITMFIDEGKVAAQLTHPNIAQIYELGETMGGYYLAMEYIAGKDLRSIMRLARKEKKNLAIPQAVVIASKLLSGLSYAHRKKGFNNENLNIVHRDVSPQNVLISYEGEVKLVDFGIAKAAAKNSITLTGALKGKILYMSPEQAWGQTVDRRSDVFSVGTLLYEMLTGKRVFIADNEMAILQKVREWNPPSPSAANARISSRLDAIVMKAVEKDPDNRYQTADEMREDLEAYLHSEKPPKNLTDLGLFMRALFKDDIRNEMPELLELYEGSIEAIDPFAMEVAAAEVPATGFPPSAQTPVIEPVEEKPPVTVDEVPPLESLPPPPEPVVEDASAEEAAVEGPAEIEVSPGLVPSAAAQRDRDRRKKSGKKDRQRKPGVPAAVPAAVEEPKPKTSVSEPEPKQTPEPVPVKTTPEPAAARIEPATAPTKPKVEPTPPAEPAVPKGKPKPAAAIEKKDDILIDEDFLKPSKASSADKKRTMLIAGGAGAIILIIILIMLMSGGDKKDSAATPTITPTPTIDLQAVANANSTATAAALATETPTPSPSETPTQRPMTRVTSEEQVQNTPTPTQTPEPTDTPVPTLTATPTVTPPPTQTPIQLGAYIQYPDVKPEALTKVTPEMPKAARQMGVEGNITLKVLVSETGEVLDIETLRASDQLEKSGCVKAAQEAVKKWVFQPATHKGVPVKTHVNLVLPFRRK